MTRRFLGALQFLTLVPAGRNTASLGKSAVFFPFLGALLGLSAAGVLAVFDEHVGRTLAALLSTGWLVLVTGCLHEDGLADVADAFRAGRSRERIMSIMLDSRIGTYGGAALVMSTLIRWQALALCMVDPWRALPAALTLSRASLVVMGHITPTVGEGLGQEFARGCTRTVVAVVLAQAVGVSLLAGWRLALTMLLASGATILLARAYFVLRLGGVNGDCLGATSVMVEMVNLVILAWK